MSTLRKLLSGNVAPASPAKAANPAPAISKPSNISRGVRARITFDGSVSSSNPEFLSVVDLDAVRRTLAVREQRRARVLAELEADPSLTYAWHVDESTDPVTVTVAIRGKATAELSIEADRFEPWRLAQIIRAGSSDREAAKQECRQSLDDGPGSRLLERACSDCEGTGCDECGEWKSEDGTAMTAGD